LQSTAKNPEQLRFLTCGSVDDGKSTLIGRLLYDSNLIKDDQFAALAKDSARHGTTGDELDFALLVDGLQAEREQGITIDVAYRYFNTSQRSFVVADAPGHEQYTRNMVTGAANAQLAIILVDARKGILTQTKRHSLICSLLGIRHVVVAINKIDLVDYSQLRFDETVRQYTAFSSQLDFTSVSHIPISARYGDNVARKSEHTPWYAGPTLVAYLENIDTSDGVGTQPFRMPVQYVIRSSDDYRGYAGTIASGQIKVGDTILVAGNERTTTVLRIIESGADHSSAQAGDAVAITVSDNLDIGRGDLLAAESSPPDVAGQFAANIIWMDDEPLIPGRSYLMRIGTRFVPASITSIRYKIDVNTRDHVAARSLGLNEFGYCNVATNSDVAFDPYNDNKITGALIIIDRYTNRTVGAGMIAFPLRRATNVKWQPLSIDKSARAALKQQKPAIIWFTGLSGAGKTTIANIVEQRLCEAGYHTTLLDGDNLRHGLNRDLGFTEADRVENIRRVGEVAKLMLNSGLITLCAFISPYRAERDLVRSLVEESEFIEVFVDTPLEDCLARDPKGLYAKAKAGLLKNFTGIDAPYEIPVHPELHLRTPGKSSDELATAVIEYLQDHSAISNMTS
jgi:bifunctional enzyme CysN/CysC